ncbi:hypothetical protein [Methylobacterium mesophilicum]|uniref:hypothetical protein n=1 Tax=Methylobacterium mesophilicum TaxID=39956 RepID=UPI002F2C8363
MTDGAARGPEFWERLADHVTATVQPVLRQNRRGREPVIIYLRDLETLARRECDDRDVIQIIVSARRLLGDRDQIGPDSGPFSRT